MQTLSALEAISPAWNHTRSLFASRKWSTLLKIGFIALVANAGSFNPNFRAFQKSHIPGIPASMAGMILLFVLIGALVGLGISLVIFYCASRLQFVLFELVLRRDTVIGPMWRRYGPATWRWIGLKLLFFLVACIVVVPFLLPSILHFIHYIPAMKAPSPAAFWLIFKTILILLIPVLIAAFVVSLFYRLLYDFGLPSMALEGTPIGETVTRVLRLVRSDSGQVALYLLLLVLLGIATAIASLVIYLVAILIAAIPLGGIGVGLWFGLRHAGLGGHILMGFGFFALALAAFVVICIVMLLLVGYTQCFFKAYSLYFLGGRYPLLGAYLEPTPPVIPVADAQAGYPESSGSGLMG